MNASKIVTVTWLNELEPSVEAREVVIARFELQTGKKPSKVVLMADLGIWGVASEDAVMLFKVPSASPSTEEPTP